MVVATEAYGNSARTFPMITANLYTTPPRTPLLDSGFIKSGLNLHREPQSGETFSVVRPGKVWGGVPLLNDAVIIGGIEAGGPVTATNAMRGARSYSAAGGNKGDFIDKAIFNEIISATPWTNTQAHQVVGTLLGSHYAATCESIEVIFFDAIHNVQTIQRRDVKTEENLVTDSGNAEYAMQTTLEDTAINGSTAYEILQGLDQCTSLLADRGFNNGSPMFVLTSFTVYRQLKKAFSYTQAIQSSAWSYFSAGGYTFVNIPHAWYTLTGVSEHTGYLLSQDSMAFFTGYNPVGESVIIDGNRIGPKVVTPEYFGPDDPDSNIGWLKYSEAFLKKHGDPLFVGLLAGNDVQTRDFYTASFIMNTFPPSGESYSEAVSVYALSQSSGVRIRPEKIQQIAFLLL